MDPKLCITVNWEESRRPTTRTRMPIALTRADTLFDGVHILTAPGLVMTPSATTEALVEWAVGWIGSRPLRVADVGTGSGAVAVAVALPRRDPESGRLTTMRRQSR